MANPLFNLLGGGQQNGMMGMLNQFNQFRQTFSGDPKEQVQQLLNSGRMSQQQYNELARMAEQMSKFIR